MSFGDGTCQIAILLLAFKAKRKIPSRVTARSGRVRIRASVLVFVVFVAELAELGNAAARSGADARCLYWSLPRTSTTTAAGRMRILLRVYGMRAHTARPGAHYSGFVLQPSIVVNRRHALPELRRGPNEALPLLYDVPGFVWKMVFLPRPEVDVTTLSIGKGLQASRVRGVIVDAHTVHRHSRQCLYTALEGARKAPPGMGRALTCGGGALGQASPLQKIA